MKIENYIEHTLLKPDASDNDLIKLYKEAAEYGFFGVCVNSRNTKSAEEYLRNTNVKIVTVIGFPLGACTSQTKAFEALEAVKNGADEIDMVINLQALKSGDYEYAQKDIAEVKKACSGRILKVIIETDLLEKSEIVKACEIIKAAGADFAKTSTGFVKNGAGAKAEDIRLMAETLKGSGVRIKASGGIKTREQALEMIEAGASRIGTSSGAAIAGR